MNQTLKHFAVLVMIVAAVLASTVVCPSTSSAAQEEGITRVKRLASAEQLRRELAVIRTADVKQWPKSQSLKFAPQVSKSLLLAPDLVTGENKSYDVVVLDGIECARLSVSWRQLAVSDAPIPADLPEMPRKALEKATAGLPADARKRKYEQVLERYRQSKSHTIKGQMFVSIVVAPSSEAAQEYIIFQSTGGCLPTKTVAAKFDKANRISGLGDVAFKSNGTIRFIRNNVSIVIRGIGVFTNLTEALALKLDAAIVKQQPYLDLRTFLAARPHVTVGPLRHESAVAPGQPALSFSATAAPGTSIAAVRATVDGKPAPVSNQEVRLGSAKGQMMVKITAITNTLLVSSVEQILQVER